MESGSLQYTPIKGTEGAECVSGEMSVTFLLKWRSKCCLADDVSGLIDDGRPR